MLYNNKLQNLTGINISFSLRHLSFVGSALSYRCAVVGSALWSHSEAHTEEATATQGSSHGDGKGTRGQAHQHEHTADLCFHHVHQQPTGL